MKCTNMGWLLSTLPFPLAETWLETSYMVQSLVFTSLSGDTLRQVGTGGLGLHVLSTGCLPKWAPNPFMELGICEFYRPWTVTRVLNCERRAREGEMNE